MTDETPPCFSWEIYLGTSSGERKHVTSVSVAHSRYAPRGCCAVRLSGAYRRPLPTASTHREVVLSLTAARSDGGRAAREYAAFAAHLRADGRSKGPKAAVVEGMVPRAGGGLVHLDSSVVVARGESGSLELVLMVQKAEGAPPTARAVALPTPSRASPPAARPAVPRAEGASAPPTGMLSLEEYAAAVTSGLIKKAIKGGAAAKYAQGWSFDLDSRRWKKRALAPLASNYAAKEVAAKDARIEELLEQLSGLSLAPTPPTPPPPPPAPPLPPAAEISFHFLVFDTNMLIDQVGELERAFLEFRETRLACIRRLEADLAAVDQLMAAPQRTAAEWRAAMPALDALRAGAIPLHCDSVLVPNWVLRELDGLKKSSRPHARASRAGSGARTTTVGAKARWAGKVVDGLLAASVIVSEARRRELAAGWALPPVDGETAAEERPERDVRRKLLRALDILTAVPLLVGQRAHELYTDRRGGLHARPASLRADDAILNCCLYFALEPRDAARVEGTAEWCQRWGVDTTLNVDNRALRARLARSTVALCSRDRNFRSQAAIHGVAVQEPLEARARQAQPRPAHTMPPARGAH